ncbi:MAG: hypothetical protein RIK87_13100 [Fuerstiella sp.]
MSRLPFGPVQSSAKTVAGWNIKIFQPATEYAVHVTIRDGAVSSLDVVFSQPQPFPKVVGTWRLGGLIPASAFPAGALIGPVLSRHSQIARTRAGALLIFTPMVDGIPGGEALVERIRIFASEDPDSLDAPQAGTPQAGTPDDRFGAVVSNVPPQLARQLELTDGQGVMLTHVRENLLVWHLGMESNDVVIQSNGEAIRGPQQFSELLARGDLTKRRSFKVIRNQRHTVLDVQVPPDLLKTLRAPPNSQDVDPLQNNSSIATTSRVITFQGVTPGVTTERELLANDTWGRAESRELITPLLTLWKYHVAEFEVSVATWGDRVQTIDIHLKKGASIASAERLFGMTQPANDVDLSSEMLAGQTVSVDLHRRPYADKHVVLFTDNTASRPVVRIIRLYADDDPGKPAGSVR